jgi:hypothetical protein
MFRTFNRRDELIEAFMPAGPRWFRRSCETPFWAPFMDSGARCNGFMRTGFARLAGHFKQRQQVLGLTRERQEFPFHVATLPDSGDANAAPGERKKSIRFKALQVLHFASEFMGARTATPRSRRSGRHSWILERGARVYENRIARLAGHFIEISTRDKRGKTQLA